MSDNKHPSVAQVATHFYSLTEEERGKIGDIETAEGYSKALESFFASMGGEETLEQKERKKKEARMYVVLLVVQTGEGEGKIKVVGHGLGSIGREATEPTKWSPARMLQNRAEIQAFGLRAKGQNVTILNLPVEEYVAGSFLDAPKVEAPKVEETAPAAE